MSLLRSPLTIRRPYDHFGIKERSREQCPVNRRPTAAKRQQYATERYDIRCTHVCTLRVAESSVGCALSEAHARTMRSSSGLILNAIVAIVDLFARLPTTVVHFFGFAFSRAASGILEYLLRERDESRRFSRRNVRRRILHPISINAGTARVKSEGKGGMSLYICMSLSSQPLFTIQ